MPENLQAAHRAFREGAGVTVGEVTFNPATTDKQARFMRAELGRARRGEKTRTGMSQEKIRHFTHT
jgi:hypothetical protein